MARRHKVTDEEWERIESLLSEREGDPGGHGEDNRQFVNAVV
jgi:transposase